jgi:hypothetical protein
MMDHFDRSLGEVLVALTLYWCLHMIVKHVLEIQSLALNGEGKNGIHFSICFESINMSDHHVGI